MERCTCVEPVYVVDENAHTCAVCWRVKVAKLTQLRDYQKQQKHRRFQQDTQDRLRALGFL